MTRIRVPSTHNPTIAKEFYAYLRKRNTERELNHIKSGKLSAGRLGDPTLEQILYVIGVPPKPFDDYTLGVFRRGEQVELAAIEALEPDEVQTEVEYRNVIGFEDAHRNGMPYEVKSIKNSQVKYIDPENKKKYRNKEGQLVPEYQGPSAKYALQGCLYALGRDKDYFTVLYVAADDLRPYAHVIKVSDIKPLLDKRVDLFNKFITKGELPKWEPLEEWQREFTQYSKYPDWIDLEPDTAVQKLKTQFPEAYKKLISFKEEHHARD